MNENEGKMREGEGEGGREGGGEGTYLCSKTEGPLGLVGDATGKTT